MADQKYYTPDIEEFHVGFEYESYDLSDNGRDWIWRKQIFEGEETRTYFIDELQKGEMRVKHLDREDIESMGWKFGTNRNDEDFYFKGSKLLIFHPNELHVGITANIGSVKVIGEENPTIYLFNGTIRNISELKKLMKQLNIE